MPPAANAATIVVRKVLLDGPIAKPTVPSLDGLSRSAVVVAGVVALVANRASLAVIDRFSNDSTTALFAGSYSTSMRKRVASSARRVRRTL